MSRWDRWIIANYASNVFSLNAIRQSVETRIQFSSWIGEYAADLGFDPVTFDRAEDFDTTRNFDATRKRSMIQFQRLVRLARLPQPRPSFLELRCRRIADCFGLEATDREILSLLALAAQRESVYELTHRSMPRLRGHVGAVTRIANLLCSGSSKIGKRLSETAPLLSFGLIIRDDDFFELSSAAIRAVNKRVIKPSTLLELFAGRPRRSRLNWGDFEHLGADRDQVRKLLRAALDRSARGVHVLLHGTPGTGKSEFAAMLSGMVDAVPLFVGESDALGEELDRKERLSALRAALRIAPGLCRSVLVMDEADDVLSFSSHRSDIIRASKASVHRLLESSGVPIIWTTNEASAIDPAVLRRMTYAIEFRTPPERVRARVWQRILARHRLKAQPDVVRALARDLVAAPAIAESAARATAWFDGDIADICRAVRGIARVVDGGELPPPALDCVKFDPALAVADQNLVRVAERLAERGIRRVGLCLSGPPGTGKSAYARYLADRIGIPVTQKRASDLLSKWVGGSEKRIADAFRESRDSTAMLVIDEADSLLGDRRSAAQTWEVSQVNELLTWMESHPLPFALTTNLVGRLDQAAQRRFDIRLTFGFLDAVRSIEAFRRFFRCDPPAEIKQLDQLTPGDFAVVSRRAEILGMTSPAEFCAMLAAECAAKEQITRPIGFVQAR